MNIVSQQDMGLVIEMARFELYRLEDSWNSLINKLNNLDESPDMADDYLTLLRQDISRKSTALYNMQKLYLVQYKGWAIHD